VVLITSIDHWSGQYSYWLVFCQPWPNATKTYIVFWKREYYLKLLSRSDPNLNQWPFHLQCNYVEREEAMQSPYLESIKHKTADISANQKVHTRSQDQTVNNRCRNNNISAHSEKENFAIPDTPRTARSKRPPTYGLSPPRSSHKQDLSINSAMCSPPMSNLLTTSVNRPSKLYTKANLFAFAIYVENV